ncbi:signal peptidase I [Nocardioides sp.]|uniref:signal peptidase I n=1 Tax=Nocardioides sp. TaxID=35761 RepID=UPI00356238E8
MLAWTWRVLGWVVTLAAVTAIALAVVVPRLGGATPYTVLTGSMRPGMPPGTLVVVRPVDPAEIATGAVVTYQLTSGDPTVVTHRVITQGIDGRGERVFRTQGDANEVPDEHWVRSVQIVGERWYAVPHLGHVSNLLTGRERQLGIYAVSALLVGYALSMFGAAARQARTRRRERAGATRD